MTPSAPIVSVVTSTLDRADLLQATLDSVLAQACPELEVLVIDNGSTDGTLALLADRYAGRVRVFQCPVRGLGAPRNMGIREARGRYIAFLDSDDLWFPWTFRMGLRALEQAGWPAMAVMRHKVFEDEAELPPVVANGAPQAPVLERHADLLAAQGALPYVLSCSSVWAQTDAIRRAGGFFEDRCSMEDHDLWLKLAAEPGLAIVRWPAIWAYRWRADNVASKCEAAAQGVLRMLRDEQARRYPGGPQRAAERRLALLRHARPFTQACMREGKLATGLALWHASAIPAWRAGYRKFALGAPLVALRTLLLGPTKPRPVRPVEWPVPENA